MLSMDQKNFIKDLARKGATISEIARVTSHSRNTVRAVLTQPSQPQAPFVKTRKTASTPLYADIKEQLDLNSTVKSHKHLLTAKRVYDLLCEKHGETISLRTVERMVKKARAELGIERKTAFLKLEHRPAEAQLDFGEFSAFVNHEQRKLAYLVIAFPHSNARWGIALPAQTFECLAYGMSRIFDIIGFVPTRIRFDNMSTAVSKVISRSEKEMPEGVYDAVNSPRVLNENFVRLMGHYGFVADFCRPAKGNEKGSVENAVGFLRRNVFSPILEVNNIEEINSKHLIPACQKYLKTFHYFFTAQTIESRFEDDRKFGLALPEGDFDGSTYRDCKVNNYGQVVIDTNTYPVPEARPGDALIAQLTHARVTICTSAGEILATYPRLFERQCTIIDWEAELKLLNRKPRAFRDSGFAKLLDPVVVDYIARCSVDERRIVFDEALQALEKGTEIEKIARDLKLVIEYSGADDAITFACRWRFFVETGRCALPNDTDDDTRQDVPSLSDYEM